MPAIVALSMPNTPATVITGNPHWPIRERQEVGECHVIIMILHSLMLSLALKTHLRIRFDPRLYT